MSLNLEKKKTCPSTSQDPAGSQHPGDFAESFPFFPNPSKTEAEGFGQTHLAGELACLTRLIAYNSGGSRDASVKLVG